MLTMTRMTRPGRSLATALTVLAVGLGGSLAALDALVGRRGLEQRLLRVLDVRAVVRGAEVVAQLDRPRPA